MNCIFCNTEIIPMDTKYYVRYKKNDHEYGEKQEICVFCYTHSLLYMEGRGYGYTPLSVRLGLPMQFIMTRTDRRSNNG